MTEATIEQNAQAARKVITPDLKFVKDVIKSGGESLKKCYQCATCTVVCNVTPEDNPFPRKEMVQAQWGLKDELFRNPDIWLCHQCSDCTAHCPRGAKPGEVLGAIRAMSIRHYSKPGILATMASDSKFLIPLIAVPVVVFLAMVGAAGNLNLANVPLNDAGHIAFNKFLPTLPYVDLPMMAAFGFAAAMLLMGIKGYWDDMCKNGRPEGNIAEAVIEVVLEVLGHKRFEKCEMTSGRKLAHQLVLYSFMSLAVATTLAAIKEYVPSLEHTLLVPTKIFGNVGAVGLLVGIFMVINNRLGNAEKAGKGGYYDWLFIGVVATVGVTGMAAQLIRLAGAAQLAYVTYFVHLVSVFFLFAYAPFTKMAHMLYRGTAMVYAQMTGRK
jgi:quinone-modifying oxidoreductase subunit QmoC